MSKVVTVMAPGAGFAPEALAAAWNADDDAPAAETARLQAPRGEVFFPNLMERAARLRPRVVAGGSGVGVVVRGGEGLW